ncbi:MAG: amidohydrolase [Pseudomonadota bacterium]
MNELLQVSVVEDDIDWQDPASNRARYDSHFERLKDTDLIVLPEMFSTGFYMQPWEKFETMEGETVLWMRDRANALNSAITGSVVLKHGDKYLNRMLWVHPDGRITFYDKRHLFRYGNEHIHFDGGNERVIVELKGWRIALFICYDLRFPVWSRNCDEYDLAIYVANWPDARRFAWDSLLVARAIENQCYVAASNRLGEDPNGNTFTGGSALLDFKGGRMAEFDGRSGAVSISMNLDQLFAFRESFPAHLDRDQFTLYT